MSKLFVLWPHVCPRDTGLLVMGWVFKHSSLATPRDAPLKINSTRVTYYLLKQKCSVFSVF